MKIDGIDGDSSSDRHRNWFDIFSFSWGESNQGIGNGGGGSAGRVNMSDFSVLKSSGKGSPALFLHCANGRHLPAVQCEVTVIQQDREEVYLRYTLTDCVITSYQTTGDGGSIPNESVSFDFVKILFLQNYFLPDGSVRTQTAFWDQARNQGGGS